MLNLTEILIQKCEKISELHPNVVAECSLKNIVKGVNDDSLSYRFAGPKSERK